jgi:hypothetical protein
MIVSLPRGIRPGHSHRTRSLRTSDSRTSPGIPPALCEAELMARLLPRTDFPGWFARAWRPAQ